MIPAPFHTPLRGTIAKSWNHFPDGGATIPGKGLWCFCPPPVSGSLNKQGGSGFGKSVSMGLRMTAPKWIPNELVSREIITTWLAVESSDIGGSRAGAEAAPEAVRARIDMEKSDDRPGGTQGESRSQQIAPSRHLHAEWQWRHFPVDGILIRWHTEADCRGGGILPHLFRESGLIVFVLAEVHRFR